MKRVRTHRSMAWLWLLVGLLGLSACSGTPTPLAVPTTAPTDVPTAAPPTAAPPTTAPTAVPPTVAPTEAATAAATAEATTAAASEASLMLAQNATLGHILTDADGRTLYVFMKDKPGTTNCYDKCAQAWPPLLSLGQPALADGVDSTLISTTLRTDGTSQVTYNGHPVYHFAQDQAPGDVQGQAVGNVWWVVSPEGNPVRPASLAVTQTASLGSFLTDSAGFSLYTYAPDTKDTSNCYGKCEQFWPPLLTTDKPALGDGVDTSLLGSTQRKDGSMQVTYNGSPLYYYLKDAAAGDIKGQGVQKIWYVIAPDGAITNK